MGEQFTVADAYLFTVTGWAQFVGVDISELTNLLAYRERVLARPAVQAAMKAEGDRKSTRLNSSHLVISYAVFCLKKKNTTPQMHAQSTNSHIACSHSHRSRDP